MPAHTPQPVSIPVLAGYIEDHPQTPMLHVWCRWCCVWHHHGLADAKPGDDVYRRAHCHAAETPYRDTGYCIRVVSTPFSVVAPAMREATAAQTRAIREGRTSARVQQLRAQRLPIT